jgi:hypothetical protein
MRTRDARPLSGALFVIVVLVGFVAVGGDTPDGKDAAAKVVSYYSAHHTREIVAAVVVALGAVLLIFFSATIRDRLEAASPGRSALPGFAFGSGVVAAGGFLALAGIHFALADYADDIDPTAAQALNALDSDFFLPFAIGTVALVLGISLSGLRTRQIPAWLGGIGVLAFVASFTPVGFVGLLVGAVWIVVVSVLLYLGDDGHRAPTAAPATAG